MPSSKKIIIYLLTYGFAYLVSQDTVYNMVFFSSIWNAPLGGFPEAFKFIYFDLYIQYTSILNSNAIGYFLSKTVALNIFAKNSFWGGRDRKGRT